MFQKLLRLFYNERLVYKISNIRALKTETSSWDRNWSDEENDDSDKIDRSVPDP